MPIQVLLRGMAYGVMGCEELLLFAIPRKLVG